MQALSQKGIIMDSKVEETFAKLSVDLQILLLKINDAFIKTGTLIPQNLRHVFRAEEESAGDEADPSRVHSLYCLMNFRHFKTLLSSLLVNEKHLCNEVNRFYHSVERFKQTAQLLQVCNLLINSTEGNSGDDHLAVKIKLRKFWAKTTLMNLEKLLNEINLSGLLLATYMFMEVDTESNGSAGGYISVSWMASPNIDTVPQLSLPQLPVAFMNTIGVVSIEVGSQVYSDGETSSSSCTMYQMNSIDSIEASLSFMIKLMKDEKALRLLIQTKCIREIKLFTAMDGADNESLTSCSDCRKANSVLISNYLNHFLQENEANLDSIKDVIYGGNLLHWAMFWGWVELAAVLVTMHAINPMCSDTSGRVPLVYACWNNQLNALQYLIEQCDSDPNYKDSNCVTLLHSACYHGSLDVAQYLITHFGHDPMYANINGLTSLHFACSSGHYELLKYFVKELKCDPTCKTSQGLTLLHYACSIGQLDIVQYLINDCECDPMCTATNGGTPLHEACSNGKLDVVIYLIIDCACDPMCRTNDGFTPLHFACYHAQLDVVQYLITNSSCDPMCKSNSNISPLYNSCSKNGKLDVVQYLIKECNCNAHIKTNGSTLLTYACSNGHLDIVQYLIKECGCNPMDHDQKGLTLLHYACSIGRLDIVQYLINDCECDPMYTATNGGTPLHEACSNGKLDVVIYLIVDCACDPMCRTNDGFTPLHFACYYAQLDVVQYLITECNQDPMCKSNSNITPLYNSCSKKGKLDVVRYLIKECNCDPNYKMKGGFIPLHYACCNGLLTIVQFLIRECGCDPKCEDNAGRTPLHEACYNNNLDVAQYLIAECGCDPSCNNSKGETPLHEAADSGSLSIVKYLVNECKCNPMLKARNGLTSLHHACSAGKLDIVRYLVTDCNCDPSIVTQFRMSSLFLAAFYNHFDVVAFLISNGYYLASYEIGILMSEPRIKGLLRLALKCHEVNSFVNVFLLGDSGVGKSTLTEVIKQRVNGGKILLGQFRSVPQVQSLTAGIVPHVLKHKELGNIILHDFAGQPQYYSSHSAILEDMLSGSPAIFVLVTKLLDPFPYKWLSIINDLRSKCSGTCAFFTIASHADLVQSNTARVSRVKDLEREIQSCLIDGSNDTNSREVYYLNCQKRSSRQLNLFLGSLLKSCQSLRSSMEVTPELVPTVHTAEYKMHMSMLFLLLNSTKKEVLSFDELQEFVRASNGYYLPDTTEGIIEILQYLHKIGLILFISSTTDSCSWIIFDKESLLRKVIGTLLAPEHFHNYQSFASTTGIVCENRLSNFFIDYNSKMIVEFLISMQLCERISFDMLKYTNLSPLQNYEGQQDLLFIPALLTSRERPSCRNLKFKFGWCLQSVENNRKYFTSRFLHVLILRLAYERSLVKTSENPHIRRGCTVWSTGIMWINGYGTTTLVELINNNQCLVLLMAYQEGLQYNMVPIRRDVITDILSVQQDHCASLQPKEFVIDPSQLDTVRTITDDLLSTLVLYDVNSIASTVYDRKPCVVSFNDPNREILLSELFPKEYERGPDISVFVSRDLKMLKVDCGSGHVLPNTIVTSPNDVLKKYTAKLVDCISDPERMANNLFSVDLISMSIKDQIITSIGISRYSKASIIMNEVYRNISDGNEIKKFKTFCDVLKLDATDTMEVIVLKMEQEVGHAMYD